MLFRWLWCSNTLFIILLSFSWVFAMLYVNVYALDSVVLGWMFMACSTCLVSCVINSSMHWYYDYPPYMSGYIHLCVWDHCSPHEPGMYMQAN